MFQYGLLLKCSYIMTKNSVGWKDSFLPTILIAIYSTTEGGQGRNSRQEHGGRTRSNSCVECCFMVCLPQLAQPDYFYGSGSPDHGWFHLHGATLLHQSRNVSTDLPVGQYYVGIFSRFPRCVKLTKPNMNSVEMARLHSFVHLQKFFLGLQRICFKHISYKHRISGSNLTAN